MALEKIGNRDEFKDFMMNDKSVVMIHKTSCPFCERAMPWLEEFSSSFPEAKIALANKDDIADILELFQVKMYPTFISLSNGRVVDTFFGDTVKEKVNDFLEKVFFG